MGGGGEEGMELFLEVLDPCYLLLCVLDHFAEEEGEGGFGELGALGTVQVPVVDGFARRCIAEVGGAQLRGFLG